MSWRMPASVQTLFFCNAQVLLTFERTFPLLRFDEAAVAALKKAVLRRALGLPADAGSWD